MARPCVRREASRKGLGRGPTRKMTESESTTARSIAELLFDCGAHQGVYLVIDGAKVPVLVEALEEHDLDADCVFPGQLAPDVASVAPYVVRAEAQGQFTDWILSEHWGQSALIALRSEHDLRSVVKHLRQLKSAQLPDGTRAYFRFYDPRVLRAYLPTCTEDELGKVLGGVLDSLWVEARGGGTALEFSAETGHEPRRHPVIEQT